MILLSFIMYLASYILEFPCPANAACRGAWLREPEPVAAPKKRTPRTHKKQVSVEVLNNPGMIKHHWDNKSISVNWKMGTWITEPLMQACWGMMM